MPFRFQHHEPTALEGEAGPDGVRYRYGAVPPADGLQSKYPLRSLKGAAMRTSNAWLGMAALLAGPAAASATPVSVYGAWHCGNDFCTWSTVRSVTEFDSKN